MKELKLLLYCTWRTYALDMLGISKMFAVIHYPENRFQRLICLIRIRIAAAFAAEANRSFDYANSFLEDR